MGISRRCTVRSKCSRAACAAALAVIARDDRLAATRFFSSIGFTRAAARSDASRSQSAARAECRKTRIRRHQLVAESSSACRTARSAASDDADVVAERLAHLLLPVEADEQRNRRANLRQLAVLALVLPPQQQIEELIAAAELDVGLDRDRIVRLRDGIEKLVQRDRRRRRRSARENRCARASARPSSSRAASRDRRD